MDIINPIVWAPSMLTSSSVPETDHSAWSSATFYNAGDRVILTSTHKIYECVQAHQGTTGVTATPTISMASPAVATATSHGFTNNQPILITTTGVLPAGLSPNVRYYVKYVDANNFQFTTTPNGIAINTTVAGTGTHTVRAATTTPSANLTGNSPLWLEISATNRFKMFDDKWGTQTTASNTLTVQVSPGTPIDSLALLNLIGSSVTITCTRSAVTIYSRTIVLQTDIGVYDWKTYFLAPIVTQDDVVVTDLLPYGDQIISITIVGPSTVAIGNITMGSKIEIGMLQSSPKVGIVDYSTKTTDVYGNIVVTQRAYSKRFSCTLMVMNSFVDQLASLLAGIRATPVIWVGSGSDYSSLIVWGFYKDFEVDIANSLVSYCSLTIEGLV